MSRYWFKAKSYGWGMGLPTCWQGYLSLTFLILLILFVGYLDGIFEKPQDAIVYLKFSLGVTVLSLLFVFLLRNKVDGGIKWRWGNK